MIYKFKYYLIAIDNIISFIFVSSTAVCGNSESDDEIRVVMEVGEEGEEKMEADNLYV